MSKLVWLFKEHRDLYLRNLELEQRVIDITRKAEQTIADLEMQLKTRPIDLKQIAEELFQDMPYDEGRIPDDAWLTPGQPDRATR